MTYVQTRTGRTLLGTAAAAAVVFEQSPANEAVRVALALDVLERTGSALAVGAIVFAVTIVIEGVSGGLVAFGVHQFPHQVERLSRLGRSHDDTPIEPKKPGAASLLTDIAIALGIGAAFVVLRRAVANPASTLGDHLRTVGFATFVIATVSGLIGMLVGGGINNAARWGLETPAQYVIDYGTSWRFWLVVGLCAQFGPALWRRLRPTRPEPAAS